MDILTLHSGPLAKLTSTSNKITYILKWFFSNPGFTSDIFEDDLISYRKLQGVHRYDSGTLMPAVKSSLEEVINRVCDEPVIVEVSQENIDEYYYKLQLTFKNSSGGGILMQSNVNINENNITINNTE